MRALLNAIPVAVATIGAPCLWFACAGPDPAQTAPAPAPVASTPTPCDSLLAEARATVEESIAGADVRCSAANDCVLVDRSGCLATCDSAAVAKGAEAQIAVARKRATEGPCAQWKGAQCSFTGAVPTCGPPPTPACEGGRCVAHAVR